MKRVSKASPNDEAEEAEKQRMEQMRIVKAAFELERRLQRKASSVCMIISTPIYASPKDV